MKQTTKGWFVPDQDSHISKWIEDSGKLCHDEFLPALVIEHLKPGMCIVDAGAFVGDHTISYSKAVAGGASKEAPGMVVAVEAGAEAFACLVKNVEIFPFPKSVYCLHACLGETYGTSVSHNPNENLGASQCHSVTDRIKGENYLLTVTIDGLAIELKRKIDFIKLDVEGWEVKTLIGASKVLQNDRPGLLIEVNPGALAIQGDSEEDIYDILDHHKYSWKIAQPECKRGDSQYDLLCFPLPLPKSSDPEPS